MTQNDEWTQERVHTGLVSLGRPTNRRHKNTSDVIQHLYLGECCDLLPTALRDSACSQIPQHIEMLWGLRNEHTVWTQETKCNTKIEKTASKGAS